MSRREYNFVAAKVFPPSDKLALEILCLMAAYNDMGRIVDWMKMEWEKVTKQIPVDPINQTIYEGLMFMQLRIMMGFIFEVSEVVKRIVRVTDFDKLKALLDETGQTALKMLEQVDRGFFGTILNRIRNKATFHYLASELGGAIKTFKVEFGENFTSSIVYEGTNQQVRAHYFLADDLRDAIAFSVKSDEGRKILDESLKFQNNLYRFLESAHKAHVKLRGIGHEFKQV